LRVQVICLSSCFLSRLGIQPFQLGPRGHVDSSIQVENGLNLKIHYWIYSLWLTKNSQNKYEESFW